MSDVPVPASRETLRVLAALADENRFRIVELLSNGRPELTCGAIGTALGLSPSLISHHLGILESTGLIDRRKEGLCTMNRLRREALTHHIDTLKQTLHCNGRVD